MPEVVLPKDNDNVKSPQAGDTVPSEHNIPAPPENRGLVMEDHDAIGVFRGGIPSDICKAVISSFEHWYERKYIVNDSIQLSQ